MGSRITSIALTACLLAPVAAHAQQDDLTRLSLADLMNVELTSVSRKEQPLSRTAAAAYVITQEDIRRSGARTVGDALRLAPGFSVAQLDANSWAIGSRGFSGLYASKLLVLVDGRTVYTPLWAGVHWEMLNLLLDDIERIEVIRGPGGTSWGANAVNGVVNIITKTADATRGGLVHGGVAGAQDRDGNVRYGAALGDKVNFRVFGRTLRRASEEFAGVSSPAHGAIEVGGGRVDWNRSDIESFSVNAMVQSGRTSETVSTPAGFTTEAGDFDESNVVVSWSRKPSSRSDTSVQFFFDTYSFGGTANKSQVADIDARHRQALGNRHEVVFGAGFRRWENSMFGFRPETERSRIVQAFIQDEIELASGLYLTPGSKFEHNDYTGFEFQPTTRLLWHPVERHVLWAAASRAVRTPSRVNRGAHIEVALPLPSGVVMPIELNGNPDMESERMRGFEAGYRVQFGTASLDVAAFRNAYDRLQSAEPVGMSFLPNGIPMMQLTIGNGVEGDTKGVEVVGTWSPATWVRFTGNYTRLALEVRPSVGSHDVFATQMENSTAPRQQVHGRVYVDLPYRLDASALVWRVGALEGVPVDAYTRLDLRLGWEATRRIELALGAQNLLRDESPEYFELTGAQALPNQPAAFGEVKWRF
jgi:iron complex outermembrane recepter protein